MVGQLVRERRETRGKLREPLVEWFDLAVRAGPGRAFDAMLSSGRRALTIATCVAVAGIPRRAYARMILWDLAKGGQREGQGDSYDRRLRGRRGRT